jgi:hypothetical protein
MRVAVYARVSTNDKEQNPETHLRPLREHIAGLTEITLLGEYVDKASADDLQGVPLGTVPRYLAPGDTFATRGRACFCQTPRHIGVLV